MRNIPYSSVPDMLRKNAAKFQGKPALKYRKEGKYVSLSYEQFYEQALMTARGLQKLGVQEGDRIALLSESRAEWVIADMGILIIGAVNVPIYPTNTPEQVEHMLRHSGARIVFVSSLPQYSKLLNIRKSIPSVEVVVSFEHFPHERELPALTFQTLSAFDDPITRVERDRLEAGIDRIGHDHIMTLIYTSGTTGAPKGVMLTNRNILFDAWYGIKKVEALTGSEVVLSFLPLSHVFERTIGYYITIMNGALMAFADSVEKTAENMLEVKPTVMVSVPRLFEKIYSRIYENVGRMPTIKRKLFHWAVRVGKKYVEAKYVDSQTAPLLAFQYSLADRLVFTKLRERFGGRMKFFVSGGAPLDKNINLFFWSIGVPILEGYGLTETSPAVSLNNFRQVRFGSVGTLFDQTEIKVAHDGELLIRGPQLMAGYFKDPEATKEALKDGWFRSGDLGHVDNGFVYITGRKKEIIITAGGKNIAHRRIEYELQNGKYIAQAVVYGDRRPFLIALLVPNFEQLVVYAQARNLGRYDPDYLLRHESVRQLYSLTVDEVNSKLAPYETIKKFALLPRDFSIEGGELTLTQKLKRHIIYEKYKDMIDELYADTRR